MSEKLGQKFIPNLQNGIYYSIQEFGNERKENPKWNLSKNTVELFDKL
jgi:hypothetical protein